MTQRKANQSTRNTDAVIGWLGILRIGLVQTSLGSIVVLTTSTLNRIMVVELSMVAILPGLLIGLHYFVQILRPRMGHGSDVGGRRTPWIIGGIGVLGTGGIAATAATWLMSVNAFAGIICATLAFVLIGIGVGASGTALLALLAKLVDDTRRAAAATIVWVMMIAGFVITAATAGHFMEPFTFARLLVISVTVSSGAFLLSVVAMWGLEKRYRADTRPAPASHAVQGSIDTSGFRRALSNVWDETRARRFTIFVFVSMLAYSAQDLILEPFAGSVFSLSPGESTQLSGLQHGGVLAGMITVALSSLLPFGKRPSALRLWTTFGCVASAAVLLILAIAANAGPPWPLHMTVFFLGLANGTFAVGAIGTMMHLAKQGQTGSEGIRMGLWGAAQAIAFGIGGFLGTASLDLGRFLIDTTNQAYAVVFLSQAVMFSVAAFLAIRLNSGPGTKEKSITMGVPNNIAAGATTSGT